MMKAALRTLIAVIIGLLVAFVLVVAVELFSAVVHPLPKDFQGTTEEMCRHERRYPRWVLAVVVPAWAVTAFAGTWIARKMGNLYSSVIVGLLLLAALVLNISMLPFLQSQRPKWWMIVQDGIKLLMYREDDRRRTGRHPFLARLNTVLHPHGGLHR